jgi:hypothetical protein
VQTVGHANQEDIVVSTKVALVVERAAHLVGRIVVALTVAEVSGAPVVERDVALETDLHGLVGRKMVSADAVVVEALD